MFSKGDAENEHKYKNFWTPHSQNEQIWIGGKFSNAIHGICLQSKSVHIDYEKLKSIVQFHADIK
jgi:hypothetical protein